MKIEKIVRGADRMENEDLASLYGGNELMTNANNAESCTCSGGGNNSNNAENCRCGLEPIVVVVVERPTV